MLTQYLPSLRENKFIDKLNAFYRSGVYIAIITALMVIAEVFAAELVVYYCYLVLGVAGLLFTDDALPVLPIAICSYMAIAPENNPALYTETSVFYNQSFTTQLTVIIVIAAIVILARFFTSKNFHTMKAPALWVGFLALGLSFIFAGAFSGYYSTKTALFGFTEIACLCFLYFYFYYTIDWSKTGKDYILKMFFFLGFGIALQIISMYDFVNISEIDLFNRGKLYTGWGMYNNVGCVMAMCMPAPFYFAAKKKRGFLYFLCGILFLVALFFTQSRGSILTGVLLSAVAIAYVFVQSKGWERVGNIAAFCVLVLVGIVLIVVMRERLSEIFSSFLSAGMDDSGRFEIYVGGWNQFKEHPVFGVGFYECDAFRYGAMDEDAFLPARYHNTIIQLLASGGIVALIAYAVHRAQTIYVALRRFSDEKFFIALTVAVLLCASLVDCHFFNLGPGLLYSCLLVFCECGGNERFKGERRIKS